jgi:hypothetical protein
MRPHPTRQSSTTTRGRRREKWARRRRQRCGPKWSRRGVVDEQQRKTWLHRMLVRPPLLRMLLTMTPGTSTTMMTDPR